MSDLRVQVRRIAIAVGASAAMVLLIAALLPRAFLVNDDPGLVLNLRIGMFSPWISPVLNKALVSSYEMAPGVPWYGLYLYGLVIASGAVLFHTCFELRDPRPGIGRTATWIGAAMLVASHAIVAIGITWTAVSMSALGTALVAFVAHLQTCHTTKKPASRLRSLIYGALFGAAFMLRPTVIIVVGAALVPLLGWIGVRFLRSRHLPRPTAVLAFLAPVAVVLAVGTQIPQPGAEYEEFNRVRGYLSDYPAFANLDKRAPELLESAGWTLDEYRDFSHWLLADDTEFSTKKLLRLRDTWGVPQKLGVADYRAVVRGIVHDSPSSVWLFVTVIVGGILLALLGVVDRWRTIAFCLLDLAFLTFVPLAMSTLARFPQRLSLSFYTVAAFGMFVFLVGQISARPPQAMARERMPIPIGVFTVLALLWGRNLIGWVCRDAAPNHATLRAFADRVKARDGIVMTAIGIIEMDPLLADPRGYDSLPSGWGTFTAPWYRYIHRFGIKSGSELLHKMIDNPNAYVVATPYGHDTFLEWIRRRVKNPAIRFSLIDTAAGLPSTIRPELYRLVTTPLERDSEEWHLLARNQWSLNQELPGPPSVANLSFRSVVFGPPYDQHLAPLRRPATIALSPLEGGVRCSVTADTCADAREGGDGGIHIPVRGMKAARFQLTLLSSENILSFNVQAQTTTDRAVVWRWILDPAAPQYGTGTITLVPGYPAHRLALVNNSGRSDEIVDLHVFIKVRPGTQAGFELHSLAVAP